MSIEHQNLFTEKSLRNNSKFPFCPQNPDEQEKLMYKEFITIQCPMNNYIYNWDQYNFIMPNFEQKFTWSKKHMDSFIESILLEMPTPNLTFYEDTANGKHYLIDGFQRTVTLLLFVKSFHTNWSSIYCIDDTLEGFSLDTLHQLSKWHEKNIDKLHHSDPCTFAAFMKYEININILQLKPSDKYNIFEYVYHMYNKFSSSSYSD